MLQVKSCLPAFLPTPRLYSDELHPLALAAGLQRNQMSHRPFLAARSTNFKSCAVPLLSSAVWVGENRKPCAAKPLM